MPIRIAKNKVTTKANRIAVAAFFFLQGFIFATWASRIPDIQQRLQLSEAGWGSVLFTLPAGLMVGLPIAGWMVAKFGSKRMVPTAALPYMTCLVAIGLVQEVWQLVGILFLFGMSANLLNLANNTQAVGVEALYGRSIMSSFHGLWSLAGFTAATWGTYIISMEISPFFHFCINGALGLLILVGFYPMALTKDMNPPGARPLFVWPDSTLLKLGLIGFCSMMCEGTLFDWSGIYFSKIVQAPENLLNLGFGAFMGAMASGRFAGDWIVARLGIRRVIQINGILVASGMLIAVLFPNLLSATFGFLLVGMGVSTIVPLVYGTAGKSNKMSAGMALAAVSSTSFLGFLLGPPLIGYVAEIANLRWSFAILALLGLFTTYLISQVRISNSEN